MNIEQLFAASHNTEIEKHQIKFELRKYYCHTTVLALSHRLLWTAKYSDGM